MRTIEDMIRQEVICNVSALVSAVAAMHGDMTEQAQELCYPIQDWGSAALEAGLKMDEQGSIVPADNDEPGFWEDWQSACEAYGADPQEREILEHWFVTKWLAEALEAKGERIDTDFAGHCVWGRTTSGQAISIDSVIMEVYADAKRHHEEYLENVDLPSWGQDA